MKAILRSGVLAALLLGSSFAATENPLGKVLQMLDDLAAKVTGEGEAEEKAYGKFVEWCDDATKNVDFQKKTLTTKKGELEAEIAKLTADIDDADVKIQELVASLTSDSKELSEATAIREKENADFAAEESELQDGIETLGKAISLVEKEMAKNPAALTQLDTSTMKGAIRALGAIVDAAALPSADKKKLLAMVQARQDEKDGSDDEDSGAPDPAKYKSQSGGILDVLEDMKEKAEEELDALRKAETSAKHNYEMLKQSLDDSIAASTKDKDDETEAKAAAGEAKATAEGDLAVTIKALKEADENLETTQHDCMQTAADHEASKRGRAEELKVIAEAKKILQESAGGAVEQTYNFLQVDNELHLNLRTPQDLANKEIVTMIKQLGKEQHSAALTQLASRIVAVLKFGAGGGADPFAKIKELITAMISKLEKEADEDSTEKAYCDEQMAKTEEKKVDLDDTVTKLTSKIDKASSGSATLKEEVKVLQSQLAALAKEQADMDKVRNEENTAYKQAKSVLEAGLKGLGNALKLLREYYGGGGSSAMLQMYQPKVPEYHSKAGGAGQGIISMLEVAESDFAKELASVEREEADSAENYEAVTQENSVDKTMKDQDVKYKTQEYTSLDKQVAELSSDRETASSELDAVMTYYGRIKDRCIAKPESYEEIKARRDKEIKGLREALEILEGEVAFAQSRKRGGLRGAYIGTA